MAYKAKTLQKGLKKTPGFQKGHPKWGGKVKGQKNGLQTIAIPIPLERIPLVSETLKKYGVDPIFEILKLMGMVDGVPEGWPLMKHQKASILIQLESLQRREGAGKENPQTQSSIGEKAMTTDELLNRVLRATNEDQLRRQANPSG